MAGKLGKIKSMLKRWHSRSRTLASLRTPSSRDDDDARQPFSAAVADDDGAPTGLHPVYVGQSRRRYLVSSDLVDHPLFRVLGQRSVDSDGGAATVVAGCEVVLFEHLLWMLENGDPAPESIEELVQFYAC
ncbi:hypothetical protein Cni_G21225 [Canna indica]|uniref:SAUR family protein n=1 Tax=Canna indica TaxID=4628 RepID=A0AAQ3KSP8_9LILI|nr:hypothetical protein Cni_G21225 [Canna indica]